MKKILLFTFISLLEYKVFATQNAMPKSKTDQTCLEIIVRRISGYLSVPAGIFLGGRIDHRFSLTEEDLDAKIVSAKILSPEEIASFAKVLYFSSNFSALSAVLKLFFVWLFEKELDLCLACMYPFPCDRLLLPFE